MNNTQLIDKFNQIVNTNSRLYDLCIEAINLAESDPKGSLNAQSEAAKEIRSYINEDELTEQEKSLIDDLEKATTLSDDMASANIDYLYNLCHRFGNKAPDKQEYEESTTNETYTEYDDTEGKAIYQEPIRETLINNSTVPSLRLLKLIPIMIAVTMLIIVGIVIVSLFHNTPTVFH
ncbi:hypothetical protein [Butyrivibrio sp. TB]|uniref:hypothetical protein n=1 Tax=Butyrivibrio sp. TB TaxID=1520809 RepID=UPI0008BE088A|nr:hypothetical protein [Butyrivibrio sp. TB]SEQ55127.1 hypothetical protein SAMN02910382_03397 [Butyrivibrio sp. TB]